MVAVGKLSVMRIAYPIEIEKRDGAFGAWFPDLPNASAQGASLQRVLASARGRMVEVLCALVRERKDIPKPSHAHRRALVAPPLLLAAKLALYQTMRDQNVSNVVLADRLGTVEGTVRRLVSPTHRSHIDAVEEALALLRKQVVLDLWPRIRPATPRSGGPASPPV